MLPFLGVLVAIGALAAAVGLSASWSLEDQESRAAERAASGTTTTTQPPRVRDAVALANYCAVPGAAWQEVPPHQPGQPSRAWVQLDQGDGIATGSDGDRAVTWTPNGSTVISPETDGRFTDDASVLERTRAVACLNHLGTDEVGESCYYQQQMTFAPQHVRTGRLRFEIVVYELHSGGILHRGEIHSRTGGCPEWFSSGTGSGLVTRAITEADVMAWLSAHFVGGRPA